MRKCEVLNDTVIAVKKGSIVIVEDKQFELAKKHLKPIENKNKEEAPSVEQAVLPKARRTRKK